MTGNRFDEAAAEWDEKPRRVELARSIGEAILREARPGADMHVCDYGCGTGLISLLLLPHVRSVTGADSSTGMLEVLNRKIADAGLSNMKTCRLNLEKDSIPPERYHLIVTGMTLHHVRDTDKVLKGFHAMLHDGGTLCIADLDSETGAFHGSEAEDVHHLGFDRDELRQQLSRAGFTPQTDVTAGTVRKPTETGEHDFTVFLITATRHLLDETRE